ncbi:MAG: hypothetical protein QNJ91_09955 [Gammaproteobacteria bacterium]|nr:hypothetical protein [Gammaproteobacteria bacterium]
MKTSKLLKKTEDILSAKKSRQRKEAESLKELLAALKKKRRKLADKLNDAKSGAERERLRKELEVVRAQRHKGLKLLKGIK